MDSLGERLLLTVAVLGACLVALPAAAALPDLSVRLALPVVGELAVQTDEAGVSATAPVALREVLPGPARAAAQAILPEASDAQRDDTHEAYARAVVAVAENAAAPSLVALLTSVALYKLGAMRWALALALGLYSRIGREDVLDHRHRDRIFDLVKAQPGLSVQDVQRLAGLGWGTTVYHLDRLERAGLIASARSGLSRRVFARAAVAPAARNALGLLRSGTPARVARCVADHPGATLSQACAELGMKPSAVSKTLAKLEAAGLVRRAREGAFTRAYPTDTLAETLVVRAESARPAAAAGAPAATA